MALLFILTGCAKRGQNDYYAPQAQQNYNQNALQSLGYMDDFEDIYVEEEPSMDGNFAMGRSAGVSSGSVGGSAKKASKGQVVQAQEQRPQSVHYNGYASLRVSRADDVADALDSLAQEVGGHVEELNPSRVTIRVPVDTFRDVFARVLEMGDVLEKSISATDISESLTSVSLRLRTAQATRDRLVKLLAKAEDENEKLELIRQIQRLTEEIDRLSGQSQTLHTLASMSRITVELVPREALAQRHAGADIAELAWIHNLSPFRNLVAAGGERLELELPEGFVELSPKEQFMVESADGARLWAGQLENQPRGDTDFWLSAIEQRLADEFGSAEVIEKGNFKLLRLVDREDDPYTYIIGVRADGKNLDLVEIYYPSSSQEQRHGEAILSVIGGGAS
jgi:hypothetical protein